MNCPVGSHGKPRGPEHGLGHGLVHADGARENARPRVGDAHDLEQTLDGAVLPEFSVEPVEGEFDAHAPQISRDVTAHIDRHCRVSFFHERLQHGIAARNRHVSLRRQAAQEHPDFLIRNELHNH
jgi:hypothetical protein